MSPYSTIEFDTAFALADAGIYFQYAVLASMEKYDAFRAVSRYRLLLDVRSRRRIGQR
jgi:hypothetical protein